MASKSDSVWAIDIGNNSLKALRLSEAGETVEVTGFDNIQHGKILTSGNVAASEKDELIAMSLRRFVEQNNLGKDDVIISVPSQNSFARFVNLPPVDQKRIPEIVKFEAAQQIPFDIDDVQWDWQQMTEPGSGEIKVGLFAIKNEIVGSILEHFSRENIQISSVQMAPMALYNYVLYDRPDLGSSDDKAIVVIDIGAESTDLVVCTRLTVWQRVVPIGGNAFTKAVSDTFKLNFEKAEKLKRTAPMSKYARQIFQAMKPVFTDMASEIQRSLGFYNSSNPNTKLTKIIALGGGTKMRGLLKYLQQSLQMPVERPDSFKRLEIKKDVSAAKFHENVSDFGVVYGLALQGLGLSRIESNLLPRSIARSMAWTAKAKYFIVAACLLLVVSVLSFARTFLDNASYNEQRKLRQRISSVINAAKEANQKLEEQENKDAEYEVVIQKEFELFKYRSVIPLLHQTVISTLPDEKNNSEQEELYKAFASGDVEVVMQTPRKERKQIFVTNMSVQFTDDLATAKFGEARLQSKSKQSNYDDSGEYEEYYEPASTPGRFTGGTKAGAGKEEAAVEEEVIEEGPGFLVVISGYCPYRTVGELMDPVGVENDPNRWGVVTRLLHLDDIVDGNSPFKLYKKTDIEHFKLETGQVSLDDSEMPAGIGLKDIKFGKSKQGDGGERTEVLIDPMTKEIISRIAEMDEYGGEKIDRSGKVVYAANDHWFRLRVKFLWIEGAKRAKELEK